MAPQRTVRPTRIDDQTNERVELKGDQMTERPTTKVDQLVAHTTLERDQLSKLLQCVRTNDRAQIARLVGAGIPGLLNYRDRESGDTALGLAARCNNDELVGALLELGASPDVTDLRHGATAAMTAALYGHVETLQRLAQGQADMTLQDLKGKGYLYRLSTFHLSTVLGAIILSRFWSNVQERQQNYFLNYQKHSISFLNIFRLRFNLCACL